ncbi:hypothetical protein BGX27_007875 [Mortierella sp. AM989]|nr:hypothetical protein BGX27_007875 [Mortierella sp. AM989]
MFASNSQTTSTDASGLNIWSHGDDDLLLSPQDVLDYSSLSEDSLSLESFSTFLAQQSPLLNTFPFQDLTPLASVASIDRQFQGLAPSAFQSIVTSQADSETAHHATLLHAYLAAQGQNTTFQQQPQWMFPTVNQVNIQLQQAQILEQMKQLEQEQQQQHEQQIRWEKEQEERRRTELAQQIVKVQQVDAQSLARYLAQSQLQIKEENTSETTMEYDAVSTPHSPSPPSSISSEIDGKSPMGSPTFEKRSLSPESASSGPNAAKNGASKLSRQLECFNCKVTQTPLWRRTPDRMHSLCNACGLYYKQYGAHRPLNVRHKLPTVLADVRLNTMPYARPSVSSSRGSSPTPNSPSSSHSSFATQDSSTSSTSDSDSDSGASCRNSSLASFPVLAKMYTEALIPAIASTQKTSPPLMIAKQGIQCVNCSQTQTPLWRKNDAGEPICNACGLYAKLHHRDRPVTMRKAKITRRRRDWGGNLAHQAQAHAQALTLAHVQAQAEVEALAQTQQIDQVDKDNSNKQPVVSLTAEEMTLKFKDLSDCRPSSVESSDSEEDLQPEFSPQQQRPAIVPPSAPATSSLAQNLSNNSIMDDNKFTDLVGQMSAHQMNRFLSVLETRCGVLRERLLATTEASAQQQQSSLDMFF